MTPSESAKILAKLFLQGMFETSLIVGFCFICESVLSFRSVPLLLVGQFHILTIGMELAYDRGSCWGTNLHLRKSHPHLPLLGARSSLTTRVRNSRSLSPFFLAVFKMFLFARIFSQRVE